MFLPRGAMSFCVYPSVFVSVQVSIPRRHLNRGSHKQHVDNSDIMAKMLQCILRNVWTYC